MLKHNNNSNLNNISSQGHIEGVSAIASNTPVAPSYSNNYTGNRLVKQAIQSKSMVNSILEAYGKEKIVKSLMNANSYAEKRIRKFR